MAGFTEAFQRALLHREKGQVEDAIREFREAIRLSPRSAPAHGNLALLLAVTGRSEEAVAEFRAALEADETDDGAHFQLGMLLTKLGRPEQAAAAYQGFLTHAQRAPQEYRDYARRQIELLKPRATAGVTGAAAAQAAPAAAQDSPAAPDREDRGAGLWFWFLGRVAAPTLSAGTAVGAAANVAGLRGLALRAATANPLIAGGACVLAAAGVIVGIPWAIATRGSGGDQQSPGHGPAFMSAPEERPVDEAPSRSSLMSFADKMIAAPPAPTPAPAEDRSASAPAPRPSQLGVPPPVRPRAPPSPAAPAAEKPRLPPSPGASGGFAGQFSPLQRRAAPVSGTNAGSGGSEPARAPGKAHAIRAEGAIGQLKFAEQQALRGASSRTDAAAAAMGDSSFAQQTTRGAEADAEEPACAKRAKRGGKGKCPDAKRRRDQSAGDAVPRAVEPEASAGYR